MKKVLLVFGTRPEAIKMAPLVHALKADDGFIINVCVTAQLIHMASKVNDAKPEWVVNKIKIAIADFLQAKQSSKGFTNCLLRVGV